MKTREGRKVCLICGHKYDVKKMYFVVDNTGRHGVWSCNYCIDRIYRMPRIYWRPDDEKDRALEVENKHIPYDIRHHF